MKIASLVVAGLAVVAVPAVHAQENSADYPVDTVTLVTHSSPGGGSDVFLREMARVLGPVLGATVVVENITGGSGATAMAHMAQAPADGSTFYATTPTYIYTSLLSNPQYTYEDLEPLANFFIDPEVLFTAADGPLETLGDAMQKARDGKARWGAANPASLERQSLERLKTASGLDAAIVTHEGGGDLMINVLNGTIDMGVGEIQELQGQLEAGKVRILASLTDERIPDFPDVPTVQEEGYDVAVRKFRGLAGPKGLPDDVIAAWEKAIPTLLDLPEYKERYEAVSLRPTFIPHDEYAVFTQDFANDAAEFLRKSGVIE